MTPDTILPTLAVALLFAALIAAITAVRELWERRAELWDRLVSWMQRRRRAQRRAALQRVCDDAWNEMAEQGTQRLAA